MHISDYQIVSATLAGTIMSVHYKFKSALDYDTVTFDGLHISIGDFKKSVGHQKRFGKSTDFDLQVTNAQTKEGQWRF